MTRQEASAMLRRVRRLARQEPDSPVWPVRIQQWEALVKGW